MKNKALSELIGHNIRMQRIARKMTIDDLADLLKLTPGFVGLIERGMRGTSSRNLLKLSEIFNVSIDSLFSKGNNDTSSEDEDYQKKKIMSLITDFSEDELEFVIQTLKGFRQTARKHEVS